MCQASDKWGNGRAAQTEGQAGEGRVSGGYSGALGCGMDGRQAGDEAGLRLDAARAVVCRLAPLLPTLIPGFGDGRNFMLLEMSQLGVAAPQELAASVWSGSLVHKCNVASSSISCVYLPSTFCLVTEGPHTASLPRPVRITDR